MSESIPPLDSSVIEKPRTRYDQVVDDTVTVTPGVIQTKAHGRGTKLCRDLTTTVSSNKLPRITATKGGPSNIKTNDLKTAVQKVTTENANIAFRVSFSIPLIGIIPANLSGTNC